MNLENLSGFENHRPVLLAALNATTGNVLEMGMGMGSTPYLSEYCIKHNRNLTSLENNEFYFSMFDLLSHDMELVDWTTKKYDRRKYGVVFIDHAPAEQRHIDAIRFKNKTQIIVVHDCEHEGKDYDSYFISRIANNFKYRKDFKPSNQVERTVMFSNFIDVSNIEIPTYTTK
jgi:predicted O-methyltransferase YrrM